MKTLFRPQIARSRLAVATLLALAAFACGSAPAVAQDCGGPLSGSTGNVVGSVAGAVGGGLLGSQFGGGAGKGLMTGLGVVGGALAGGYAGRQVEGCPSRRPQAATAAGAPARACQFVTSPGTIDGQNQQIVGIACLDPDNVWRSASGPKAEQAANVDLVLKVQQRLHDQGYYVRNNIDGRWGPATSAALRNFQQANGVAPSGQLDAQTKTALGVDPVQFADLTQGGQPAPDNPPAQNNPTARTDTPATTTPVSADHSSIYK